jgi:hypothetical protein
VARAKQRRAGRGTGERDLGAFGAAGSAAKGYFAGSLAGAAGAAAGAGFWAAGAGVAAGAAAAGFSGSPKCRRKKLAMPPQVLSMLSQLP